MLILLVIGLIAGAVTVISPCVLPVLPILLAGGASGRRPLRIIAGLVLSFCVFTLFATWLLGKLGLPDDLLRNLAIAFLFAMAVVLLVPQAGSLLERALAVFSRLRLGGDAGGGFALGVSLGLVFVPCAGPFLAAITAAAANENFGIRTIAATAAYSVGAAVPMLAIAYGGRGAAARISRRAELVRAVSGIAVGLVAIGLVFHLDDRLAQVSTPWTTYLQKTVEGSKAASRQLRKIRGEKAPLVAAKRTNGLPDYGVAPPLAPTGVWINSKPFTLAQLRGKVVLVDFWTYSCINCLRTLPHLESWYARYHRDGLEIVGVHTPEFAFEHVASNVRAAVERLGIDYPVVQDNDYKTWDNYANEYWPAEYLIDKAGHVVHTNFGEGEYAQTEDLIRRLLGVSGSHARQVANTTPTELLTPETYLGYARLATFAGSRIAEGRFARYRLPRTVPQDEVAYGGTWRVGPQAILAGAGATIELHFHAEDVYLVAGGRGTIRATIDGRPAGTMHVDAERLYTIRSSHKIADATLELRFSRGLQAYSFTFG